MVVVVVVVVFKSMFYQIKDLLEGFNVNESARLSMYMN